MSGTRNLQRAGRRGIALLLTMIFLALFACLAVAIVAASDSNLTIARNRIESCQAAAFAETGVQLTRQSIGGVIVPVTHNAADVHNAIATQLRTVFSGSHMVNSDGISVGTGGVTVPTFTLVRPDGRTGAISLNILSSGGAQDATTITVRSVAVFGGACRAVTYNMTVQRGRNVLLDYGIASKGVIQMQGNNGVSGANITAEGSILSDTYSTINAIQVGGHSSVSGNAAVCNPDGQINVGGSSHIDGQQIIGAPEPDWPVVDITPFTPYATNVYSGGDNLTNVRIPPNTNPSFNGNTTITGVLYIQSPNVVEFKKDVTVVGCIVCEPPPINNPNTNQIQFKANVYATGVEHLPAGSQFDGLRDLKGSFLLAPGFYISTWANSVLNVDGCIVASAFGFGGGPNTRVKGGILNLSDNPFQMSGNSTIIIDRQGAETNPAGLVESYKIVCVPGSYAE